MVTQLADVLAWVLIHSLWQGLAIAAVVLLLLRAIPARCVNARYLISLIGLLAVVLCMLATGSVLRLDAEPIPPAMSSISTPSPSHGTQPAPLIESSTSHTPASPHAEPEIRVSRKASSWSNWLLLGWLIGVSVMMVRTAAAIIQVRSWRQYALPFNNACLVQLEAILQELYGRLGFRRAVSLIISDRVTVPSIIGTLWPCILVPSAMLTGIPPDQWRIILAHELAHIRRHDVLVNLVQMLIESVLFFNPAVWWLSHQIRVEREACCDALAAKICGESLTVARTLVEFAASLELPTGESGGHQLRAPSSVLASFADPAATSDLTDRVQRLIKPDVAAYPRVSWWGLLTVISLLGVTGLALGWGTNVVVKTAAHLMSPLERVAKLEQIQSEITGIQYPPEPVSVDAKNTRETKTAPTTLPVAATEMAVSVHLRTHDGAMIPKGTRIQANESIGNSTGGRTLLSPVNVNQASNEFRHTAKFHRCQLRIGVNAPGYAPIVTPILDLRKGDLTRTVDLVLQPGSVVKMLVRDQQGIGIPKAHVKASVNLKIAGGMVGLANEELTADEQGVVTMNHVGDASYDLQIRAHGFQRKTLIREFSPTETTTISLEKAVPAQFQVTDKMTGQPVAQARFVMLTWDRENVGATFEDPRFSSVVDHWMTLGLTGADGRVDIDELQDGYRYAFGIVAPGYGMAVAKDVRAGQPPSTIQLLPPYQLAGRVTGALDRLAKGAKQQKYLEYNYSLSYGREDYSRVPVDAECRFHIDNLADGEIITIQLPDRNERMVVAKSITDLEFHIPPTPPQGTRRDVIIRLTGTTPQAPARGTLVVWGHHPDPHVRANRGDVNATLRENQIQTSFPIGTQLYIRPHHLIGYQFDEHKVDIVAGESPQVINIPVRVAGGILTTIVRSDGTPAADAHVRIFAPQLPPGIERDNQINPSSPERGPEILSSLPLGGRYRVLAMEFNVDRVAWAISDVLTLDESQPIAKLQLRFPAGRLVPIRVLGPDGLPAREVPVTLNISFSTKSGTSYGNSAKWTTNDQGIALFQEVPFDATFASLKVSMQAEVTPASYCGWMGEVDPRSPPTIRLKQGLTASGVLVEASSGKPIPNAPLRISPLDYNSSQYWRGPRTTTDGQGLFHFEGLEPIVYRAHLEGAVTEGTVVTTKPDGGVEFAYPKGENPLTISAGDKAVVWKVIIYPGSQLKVAD